MTTYKDIWQEVEINEGINYHYMVGPLDIWVNRADNEWQIAFDHDAGDEERLALSEEPAAPINLDWHRWIVNKNIKKMKFTPVMPDRPIVVRTQVPVKVTPGQTAVFFVAIPVFLKITTGDGGIVLCEEPSNYLSNTWFGEIAQGELCYSLKTTARLKPGNLQPHHYKVICPVEITNNCNQLLTSDCVCLRVQYLNIYRGNTRLWGNISRVAYYGVDQLTKINYDKKVHEFDGEKILIGPARTPGNENLLHKTFHHLTSFKI